MNKVITPLPSAPTPREPPPDPFRYGWRDVSRPRPDGTVDFDRVPLTLEDLLHPQFGDVILQNSVHQLDLEYLAPVLRNRLAGINGALLLVDCKVTWDDPRLGHHSPDLSVIFNVRRQRENWSDFDVAVEGVGPTMIIEVVSPNSRVNDVVSKLHDYHQAKVPLYVIVDRQKEEGPVRLLGYRHSAAEYEPLRLDQQGRLLLEPLRLNLGTQGNRVVLYDAETGEELGDYQAEAKGRRDAEKQAEAEAKARQIAETRIAELEAKLRELTSD